MRSRFDEKLNDLHNSMIEIGALIENAITLATNALISQDVEMAHKAILYDSEIDDMEKEIESMCLKLLLQQQPVASDLRMISSALKMLTDIERIGDQATDISEITILLSKQEYIKKLEHIPQMAEATIKMVTNSVDAFVKNDLDMAKSVII